MQIMNAIKTYQNDQISNQVGAKVCQKSFSNCTAVSIAYVFSDSSARQEVAMPVYTARQMRL